MIILIKICVFMSHYACAPIEQNKRRLEFISKCVAVVELPKQSEKWDN